MLRIEASFFMNFQKSFLGLAVAGLFLGVTYAPGLAHGGAHGIVQERMDGMIGIAAQFKVIGEMALGRRALDGLAVGAAADELTIRATEIPHQFPQGSEGTPSDARSTIWRHWESFAMLSETLAITSQQLSEVASSLQSADDLRPHVQAIGNTCRNCHRDFRN